MSNLPVSVDAIANGIAKTVSAGGMDSDGMSFLKLTKGGFWVYGSDDMEVEDDSLWAVNPNSFATGYIAWGDSSNVLGEEMAPVTGEPILLANLPDVGATWAQQVAMQLVCVSGEDTGEQVLFKSSSKGGRKRFNEFLQQVLVQLTSGIAGDKIVPVIELDSDSYKHKKYGTIYQPVFNIDKWVTMADGFDTAAAHDDPEPDAEPEPEPEPKKPARKRRARRAKAA